MIKADSYISIEEQKVSRKLSVPQQINLELQPENLEEIANLQANKYSLSFSSELLVNLRYYGLLQCHNQERSGLNFTTYYWQNSQKIAVISSNISLYGKISQQIRHEFLSSSQLLEKIINTHYWSINQILKQLPLTKKKQKWWLFWIVPVLITVIVAILIFIIIPSNFILKLIAIAFVFLVTTLAVKYLVQKSIPQWILQQLLFGIFASNISRRKLGLTLLKETLNYSLSQK